LRSPLVSVVIPTRNRPDFLRAAVASILDQTLGDFEVLVVDDASTYETAEVLAALAADDARLRVLTLPVQSGCNAARNCAFDHVRGRYVALLDDDDLALPERLAKSVARMEASPAPDVLFSASRYIDAEGRPLDWGETPFPVDEELFSGDRMFELLYCEWAWLPTCTLMLRSDRLRDLRYPMTRLSDGDSMFHCMLAAQGASFARVAETLALVRRDDSYDCMSRDRSRLLAARRRSLREMRRWLEARGIRRFDRLHARAWSSQLVREAEHVGGPRGLWRALAALAYWPRNPYAHAYLGLGCSSG
jgi:glycosyltransferase involved in cell wall biosynthesis